MGKSDDGRSAIIKEEVDLLNEEWSVYKDTPTNKEAVEERLGGYDYKRNVFTKSKKKRIVNALLFWRFVQKSLKHKSSDVRRKFLSKFTTSKVSELVKVIAMAESLPVSTWRKVLWNGNLDFMSFESFLRRITPSEIDQISRNYRELVKEEKVPKASKTFFMKVYEWAKNRNVPFVVEFFEAKYACAKQDLVQELLAEDNNANKRYITKAAMSYNLMGLDFGFNMYPKGLDDDEAVIEISPFRFLSIKTHVNDFVVDMEFGKYWRLYQTARSNYVWFPNLAVRLRTHICPGFWRTLLTHLWFWVVSPVACATLFGLFGVTDEVSFLVTSLLLVVGSLTPVWCILAAVKFTVLSLAERFLPESRIEAISEWFKRMDEKYGETFEKVGEVLAGVAFWLFMSFSLFVVGLVFLPKVWAFLTPSIGSLGAALVLETIAVYLGWKIYTKKKNYVEADFADYPLALKIIILIPVGLLIFKAALMYWWIPIWLLKTLVWFFMSIGLMGCAFLALFVYLLILTYASAFLGDDECERVFEYLTQPGLRLIGAGSFFALFIFSLVIVPGVNHGLLLGGAVFLVILMAVCVYLTEKLDRRFVSYQVLAKEVNGSLDYQLLFQNPWLRSLTAGDRDNHARRAVRVVKFVLDNADSYRAGYEALFTDLNSESLDKLYQLRDDIRSLERKDSHIVRIIKHIVSDGCDLAEADEKAAKEERAEENLKKKVIRVLRFITCWPILVAIVGGIEWFFEKVFNTIAALKGLYELFNKRCPYVARQEVLDYEE